MGGARCLGRRTSSGSLSPGKLADLAVWRLDGLDHAGITDPVAALVFGSARAAAAARWSAAKPWSRTASCAPPTTSDIADAICANASGRLRGGSGMTRTAAVTTGVTDGIGADARRPDGRSRCAASSRTPRTCGTRT